jgi:hypothetical protein
MAATSISNAVVRVSECADCRTRRLLFLREQEPSSSLISSLLGTTDGSAARPVDAQALPTYGRRSPRQRTRRPGLLLYRQPGHVTQVSVRRGEESRAARRARRPARPPRSESSPLSSGSTGSDLPTELASTPRQEVQLRETPSPAMAPPAPRPSLDRVTERRRAVALCAPLPRGGGPLDRADRRTARALAGHCEGVLLRPMGR